jgi:hypothetical protein
MWKAEADRNLSAVFSARKTLVATDEIPTDKRYARKGQLTLLNNFLKIAKNCLRF